MRCRIVNLGRAKIYNARLKVSGDGFTMHESYYGAEVPPLSEVFAGFKIVSGFSGVRNGTLVLSFEDEDGETYEQSAQISLVISERETPAQSAAPSAGEIEQLEPPAHIAGIAGACLFVLGMSALAYTRLKRKKGRRKRYL